MTIDEAVDRLLQIRAKNNEDGSIEVFFDCPNCGKSFAPDYAVTVKERVKAQFSTRRA